MICIRRGDLNILRAELYNRHSSHDLFTSDLRQYKFHF